MPDVSTEDWSTPDGKYSPLSTPRQHGTCRSIGIVAEFTVQPKTYADGSGEIEIHPILEKHVKNLAFVANPSFGRTLNPSGNSQRWTFNPALRSAYDVSKRLTLGVEYYGQSAPVLSAHSTVDMKVTDNIVWSLGVNVGPHSNALERSPDLHIQAPNPFRTAKTITFARKGRPSGAAPPHAGRGDDYGLAVSLS